MQIRPKERQIYLSMSNTPIIKFSAEQILAFSAPSRRSSFNNWLKSRSAIGNIITASEDGASILVEDQKGNKTKLSNDCKTISMLSECSDTLEVEIGDRNEISSIKNSDNLEVSFKYNQAKEISSITRGEYGSYHFDYGTDGDIARLSMPDGTSTNWENDASGHLRKVIDRNGNDTIYQFDNARRIESVVNRNGYQTNLLYSEWDQPDKIELPNGDKHEYQYNQKGKLEALNVNGIELARYNSQEETGWHHTSYMDGSELYLQIVDGRIMQGQNSTGDIHFTRDSHGRLLAETNLFANIAYVRDDHGRLVEQSSNHGPHSAYEYDALNRVKSVSAWGARFDISYHKNGSLAGIYSFNGVSRTQTNDQLGRPTEIKITKNTKIHNAWAFRYDSCDRVICEQNINGKIQYQYDNEGRLIEVLNSTTQSLEHFALDPNGNCVSGPFGSVAYNEIDQAVSIGGASYKYDLMGNVVQSGQSQYKFTANNKLQQAHVNGRLLRFEYDASGRRLSKETSSSVTKYLWAGQQLIAEQTTSNGQTEIREYLWLPEKPVPVAMRYKGQVYALHTGRRGEVLMMTDASGDVVWEAEYSAFGEVAVMIAKVDQPWRLAGHYHDSETELHYCSARYYDPKTGRYLSQDPLFLDGGNSNFYLYCGGDPLNFIDPTGEFIFTAIVVGAVVGAAIGAGIEYYRQSKTNKPTDWKAVGKAALIGGAIGAIGGGVGAAVEGLFAAGVAATVGGGAVVGFASGVASSLAEVCPTALLTGESKSIGEIAKDVLLDGINGAGIGALTGGVGGFLARRARTGVQDGIEAVSDSRRAIKDFHNSDDFIADVPRDGNGVFKTDRKVNLYALTDEDKRIAITMRLTGRSTDEIKTLLSSTNGKAMNLKKLKDGDSLFGFQTKGFKKDADNMFWVDKDGLKELKKAHFKNGKWDRAGVKNTLALPCFNQANSIVEATVKKGKGGEVIETTLGTASEKLGYKGVTSSIRVRSENKLMTGGGKQITPPKDMLEIK